MNRPKLLSALLIGWAATAVAFLHADTLAPPSISSIIVSNDQIVLNGTNGRPTYQVQMRSRLSQNWTNVSGPTTNYSAAVPAGGPQAFYRVVSEYTARYQVTFNGVDSLSLIDEGAWVSSKTVSAYALDGGTKNGTTYAVAGSTTVPHALVAKISGFPAFVVHGAVQPWATFTFTRLD